jgi:hypothetical protein
VQSDPQASFAAPGPVPGPVPTCFVNILRGDFEQVPNTGDVVVRLFGRAR